MSIVRAFCAIELTPEVKDYIFRTVSMLNLSNFKKVERENIHLTVRFYGNIKLETLKEIAEEAGRRLKNFQAFDIAIGDPGFFPKTDRARVFWFGIDEGTQELRKLYEIVESASSRFGVEPEPREFTPHITAGRFRSPYNMSAKLADLNNLEKVRYKVKVDSLVFFESRLTPAGPIYTKLYTVSLPAGEVIYHC
jgi:2'-5' RNA ligase